jgi:hypothetical protein
VVGADDDPKALLTWEDVRVTVAGGSHGAPPMAILDRMSGHARPGGGAGAHGPVRVRQDHASRCARRFVFCFGVIDLLQTPHYSFEMRMLRFTDVD